MVRQVDEKPACFGDGVTPEEFAFFELFREGEVYAWAAVGDIGNELLIHLEVDVLRRAEMTEDVEFLRRWASSLGKTGVQAIKVSMADTSVDTMWPKFVKMFGFAYDGEQTVPHDLGPVRVQRAHMEV